MSQAVHNQYTNISRYKHDDKIIDLGERGREMVTVRILCSITVKHTLHFAMYFQSYPKTWASRRYFDGFMKH